MAISDRLSKLTTDIKNAYISIENKLPKILPEEYQQVEYIESTGTQYIDTNVTNSATWEMQMKMEWTSFLHGGSGFTYASNGINNNMQIASTEGGSWTVNGLSSENPIILNQIYNVSISQRTKKMLVNGIEMVSRSHIQVDEQKICLFGCSTHSGPSGYCYEKVYSAKIYDNNILIRDYIPCYRKSDNEVGLYDLVNNVFYTNAGTGTFLKGYDSVIGMAKNTENLSTAIDSIEVIEPATAEGEDLTLTNTKAMPLKSVKVKGKTKQDSTKQSSNLFDESKYLTETFKIGTYKYSLANFNGNRPLYGKAQLKEGKSQISDLYVAISSNGTNPNSGQSKWCVNAGDAKSGHLSIDFTNFNDLYISFYPTSYTWQQINDVYDIWVSTDDVDYTKFVPDSPSPSYPQEIKNVEGKNLLPLKEHTGTFRNINYNISKTNVTLNGTGTSGSYPWIIITAEDVYFQNGTPTAQDIKNKANGKVLSIGKVIQSVTKLSGTTTLNFSTGNIYDDTGSVNNSPDETTKIIAYGFYLGSNQTFSDCKFGFMLEKGSIATTPYVPYNSIEFKVENAEGTQEQTEIFTFEEGQYLAEGGYLADDGIHNINGIKYYSPEEITLASNSYSNLMYCEFSKPTDYKGYGNYSSYPVLCSHAIYSTVTQFNRAEYINKIVTPSASKFWIGFPLGTTLEEIREKLTGLMVEYPLVTETITPYTPTQQAQWNAFFKTKTYDDITYITTDGDLAPIVKVDYYKKI